MATRILALTDRPELDPNAHNYVKALRWLEANGKVTFERGAAYQVECHHDTWCAIYDGHLCDCRPDITVNGKRLRYPAKALEGGRND